MNRRRILAITAAVLLTLFGTVVLIAYVNSAERRAQRGAELATILVATTEIEPGTPAADLAGSDRIAAREVPVSARASDAVTNLADLGDEVTVDRILADMPLVARQFGDATSAGGGERGAIDEGREVISLALEPQRALGGLIGEGDHVGVLVSTDEAAAPDDGSGDASADTGCAGTTAMVLTGVQVVDVTGVDPETGEAGAAITVSFDVDQSQAETLAFAAEYGSIWLTRQREDGPGPNSRAQTCDNIYADLQSGGS